MSVLAEQAVIGSLLMDIGSISKVYDQLRPEMFQNQILQRAYFEIRKSYDLGEIINIVVLCQKLSDCEITNDSILNTLRGCVNSIATSVEIKSYAQTLINDYKARQLYLIINRINPSPNGIDGMIGELINDLEALKTGDKSKLRHMKQIVAEQAPEHFVDKPDIGLHIGFKQLDDMLVSLEPGDITVIGARPKVGKSAFSAQIIRYLSEQGKRGVLYNQEMADKQIYERMLSSYTGIELKRIRMAKAYLNDEEVRVQAANEKMSKYELYIHTGTVNPSDIRNECRNLNLDYIVIDYLQLMEPNQWCSNRREEVGKISRAVKKIASELGVHIFLLSQLNRSSELRETKEPTMTDLREAGDIEQDASEIIMLWNSSKDDLEERGVKIIANRQGMIGGVTMRFNGALMQFEETGELVSGSGFTKSNEKTPFDD